MHSKAYLKGGEEMSRKKIRYIKQSDAYRCAESEHAYKIMMYINEIPPEDVRPVKHGKWVIKENAILTSQCSKCKFSINSNNNKFFRYCPNCGATMNLKGENK